MQCKWWCTHILYQQCSGPACTCKCDSTWEKGHTWKILFLFYEKRLFQATLKHENILYCVCTNVQHSEEAPLKNNVIVFSVFWERETFMF